MTDDGGRVLSTARVADGFGPILRVDITTEIISRIKTLLARGTLKPGGKLPPEREFARMLQVSRPALRQALKALATLGVIESRVGDGTYISTSTTGLLTAPMDFMILMQAATLPELFEVRKTLEVEMAGLAASRASDGDIELMHSIFESQANHVRDPEKFLIDDLNFHNAIARSAGNVLFTAILDSLARLMVETRRKLLLIGDDLSNSVEDHRAILKAISGHSTENARSAMLHHLTRVYHHWEQAQRAATHSLSTPA